ncbi:Uncharacterised protein [Mycobacteroides abscessus subsp. abscessus]|nr:Uncharacterised protein [Mycobacteroides abscessus subsp. abscessus]
MDDRSPGPITKRHALEGHRRDSVSRHGRFDDVEFGLVERNGDMTGGLQAATNTAEAVGDS